MFKYFGALARQRRPQAAALIFLLAVIVGPRSVFAAGEDYRHWSDVSSTWINGALNNTNSAYSEGETVPHWFHSDTLTIDQTYAFNIYYDFYKASSNACGFDRLAQYNLNRSPSGTSMPDPLPTIPNQPSEFFYVNNADITNVSLPQDSGNQKYVSVTFTATGTSVDFYWGLHLALDNAFNSCTGAATWTGGSLTTSVSNTPVVGGATMLGGGGTLNINPNDVSTTIYAGVKYNDLNASGGQNGIEPEMSGWTIEIYNCGGSSCGAGTFVTSDVTDANGAYSFAGLTVGNWYRVCEVQQDGWARTQPASSNCYAAVQASTNTTVQNFGNRTTDLDVAMTCPDFTSEPFDLQIFVVNSYVVGLDQWASPAAGVTISGTLPVGLVPASGTWYTSDPLSGTCTNSLVSGQYLVECALNADLGVGLGNQWELHIFVEVEDGTPSDTSFSNGATAATTTAEIDTTNNGGAALCASTLPVTLSSFLASPAGKQVRLDWTTSTAVRSAGFNLYAQTGSGMKKLNSRLIPSHAPNSMRRESYSFTSNVRAAKYLLEEVGTDGKREMHGPFQLGQPQGDSAALDQTDWQAFSAEHAAKGAARDAAAAKQITAQVKDRLQGGRDGRTLSGGAGVLGKVPAPPPGPTAVPPPPAPVRLADLGVSTNGIYRLTDAALLAKGINLTGANTANLALTNRGAPVAVRIGGGAAWGATSYVEFLGQAVDTIYTATNVYTLWLDAAAARRIATDATLPDMLATPPASYTETATANRQLAYDFGAPGSDPWADSYQLVYSGGPSSADYSINLDNLVGGSASTLSVRLWGSTDFNAAPDHHAVVRFNGSQVADQRFDGFDEALLTATLPAGMAQAGNNTLTVAQPADLPAGVDYDMLAFDRFSVSYPRAFVSRADSLSFSAGGPVFRVSGLSSNTVVAYRVSNGTPAWLSGVQASGGNATFAGAAQSASYQVSTVAALKSPTIQSPAPGAAITTGAAKYLVIAHPDFINADLQRLVAARVAQGLTVKVVDVRDVYARYSAGNFDAAAIRDYISYAATNLGTEAVLLVGGDTYDYRNYLGQPDISFIPSLYKATDRFVLWAPVDPAYVDTNNDNVPNLAIGRLPVRSGAELAAVVDKTLAYAQKTYRRTAVIAADTGYGSLASGLAGRMANGWAVQQAFVDNGVAAARSTLLGQINQGVALTSFVGHSDMFRWTFAGLFNHNDAAALTNNGKPTVVVQWGCWNNYFVDPIYDTMGHKLMLTGSNGAAAVLGATSLSYDGHEQALGERLSPRMTTPGKSLGAAIQEAKADLAASQPGNKDVQLGWSLLGDPALVIEP
jgi:hypothetical protein